MAKGIEHPAEDGQPRTVSSVETASVAAMTAAKGRAPDPFDADKTRKSPGMGPTARAKIATLLGPAFVAAIAYVDPGNVAANISAGAGYGYLLVWVLILANVMAVLIQYLSSKLGLVTGRSLPELMADSMSRPGRIAYWAQAEVVAISTDIAEVVGGAIALQILFGIPLLGGGIIVTVVSLVILAVQNRRGQRVFEFVIMAFLGTITLGFISGLFVTDVNWGDAAQGLIPRFEGPDTVVLAASILGATVMPHAIYLHSSLSRDRHGTQTENRGRTRHLLHASRWDVVLALFVAGGVNLAMLLLAASALPGVDGTDTIEGAHAAITNALGPAVGIAFGIGLLASSLASTSVGCYAGAAIMQGLLHVRVPIFVRRAITVIPALIILWVGVEPTWALVLSQVVLSIGIPFALIPLARLTRKPEIMGEFANGRALRIATAVVTVLIVSLNVLLVWMVLTGQA